MSDVAEVDVQESDSQVTTESKPLPWDQLREAREQHNLAQTDIAKKLRLDLRLVKALEVGEKDQLPEPVYTAGYIRAYAKLVGLPPDKIVSDYASQETTPILEITQTREKIPARYRNVQNALPKNFSISHAQMEEKKKIRLLIGALAVVVAFAIAWQITSKMTETSTPVTPASSDAMDSSTMESVPGTDETLTVNLPLPGQTTPSQPVVTTTPGAEQKTIQVLQKDAVKMSKISLSYSEDSWVDIRDARGKSLIRRLGRAGGNNEVSGVAPFEVLLGYSPGVSMEYNGEPFDLTRFQKRPVARFTLDSAGHSTPQSLTVNDKATNYVGSDD